MDLGIVGKVAFVAASTVGLGLASARRLAEAGALVAITGRRGELAQREAEKIRQECSVQAVGIEVDLFDVQSRRAALACVEAELGPVDILVLNGPGPRHGGALTVTPDEAVQAAQQLIAPHVDLVSATLPGMRERGWGRIVAVGATSMDRPTTWLNLSGVGRSGLASYLKALAKEVAADGVTVNIVQAGLIATERMDVLDQVVAEDKELTLAQARQLREESLPAKRLGTPDEFGATVAFLCSEPAAYISGQGLRVDGAAASAD